MLIRLVKMEFRPDALPVFMDIFERKKHAIRAFEGCEYLELLQGDPHQNVLFTVSHWRDAKSLEHYRSSALFKATWKQTKALFSKPAKAWSMRSLHRAGKDKQ